MPFFSGRNTIRRLAVCCVARKWGCVQNYEMLCIIFSFLKRNKDFLKRENKSLFFSPKYFEYKQYTSIYLKTFVMMKTKCYFQYLAISSSTTQNSSSFFKRGNSYILFPAREKSAHQLVLSIVYILLYTYSMYIICTDSYRIFPAQHSFDIYFDIKETFNLSKLLFVLLSSAIEENGCQFSPLFPPVR